MRLDGWQFVDRTKVFYPPVQRNNAGVTYYAPMATLTEISVDTATGDVTLLSHHTDHGMRHADRAGTGLRPDPGRRRHGHRPRLEGISAALRGRPRRRHLELEPLRTAAGAAMSPCGSQTAEILPPLSDTDPPKGMAEVVMIAIVPAIANAVTHAIGKRFYESADHAGKNMGGAGMTLRMKKLSLTINDKAIGPVDVPET